MLGGVERDAISGLIVAAKATQMQLVGRMNGTAAILEGINIDNALGEWVSFKHDVVACSICNVVIKCNSSDE